MTNISVLTKVAQLSELNPEAAQLLGDLCAADTAAEIIAALDNYDNLQDKESI